MGIVVITMPGEAKRAFVNALHRKTGEGVNLVIIQRSTTDAHTMHGKRLSTIGPLRLPSEFLYSLLLRFRPKMQKTLEYFRASSSVSPDAGYLPKTLYVDRINSDEVYKTLKDLSPDLMVVWGSKILSPRIIETAKNAINLHMGRCPKYRGTLANQCAVFSDDLEGIGATVHRVAPHVDAGDVYTVVTPDLTLAPLALFTDLNDRAQAACIDIAVRLSKGEKLPTTPQDEKIGRNLLLKDWLPSIRYAVARRMLAWERKFK
jgi:hypothetical protein